MPTRESLLQIERGELIQSVDDSRDPADEFKLITAMRTLLDTRLANLQTKDNAALFSEGARATASANVRTALDQLLDLLRDGFNFIKAIGSYAISDAERLGLFTNYGWTQGQIGELNDARIESLANQAIAATPTITNPDHQYPAALLTLITDELAVVNANQPLATGGTRQAAITARDEALVLLQKINDRVRFYYCSASDEEDQTAELASIGRQPRRNPGQTGSGSGPLPGEPSEYDPYDTANVFPAELIGNATPSTKVLASIVSELPLEDPEFLEIVVGFVDKLQTEVEELQRVWQRRDLEEVARISHWLKGAAGTMGFREFTEPGIRLMQQAREERTEEIESTIREISAMVAAIELPEPV